VVAAAGGYLLRRDAKNEFTASATVTAPADLAGTAGGNGQYVANFKVALTTSSVVKAVAKTTGVTENRLKAGLSAQQQQTSSFITVAFTAKTRARAEAVVTAAAKRTTELLAQGAQATAALTAATAKKAMTTATANQAAAQLAVNKFLAAHGYVDPNLQYQAAQSSLVQLNINRQQAVAKGTSTAPFDQSINDTEKRLASLAKVVAAYSALNRTLTQTTELGQAAQARYLTAQEDAAVANSPTLVDSPTTSLQSGRSQVIKAVVIAAGIGLVLGLGFLLLANSLIISSRQRRRVQAEQAAAAAAAEAPVPEPAAEPDARITSIPRLVPPRRGLSDSAAAIRHELDEMSALLRPGLNDTTSLPRRVPDDATTPANGESRQDGAANGHAETNGATDGEAADSGARGRTA
jgi:hypothetical protein